MAKGSKSVLTGIGGLSVLARGTAIAAGRSLMSVPVTLITVAASGAAMAAGRAVATVVTGLTAMHPRGASMASGQSAIALNVVLSASGSAAAYARSVFNGIASLLVRGVGFSKNKSSASLALTMAANAFAAASGKLYQSKVFLFAASKGVAQNTAKILAALPTVFLMATGTAMAAAQSLIGATISRISFARPVKGQGGPVNTSGQTD